MIESKTMRNTKQWLEEICAKLEIKDRHGKKQELAQAMEVGLVTTIEQLKGNVEMQVEQANRVARILGISPMLVISSTSYYKCLRQEKHKDAENWKKIYERTLLFNQEEVIDS